MNMLAGFGMTGFRSLYGGLQPVGPLSKVNLVAGQNNSGKSNILRALQRLGSHEYSLPSGMDAVQGADGAYEFAVAVSVDTESLRAKANSQSRVNHEVVYAGLQGMFGSRAIRLTADDLAWFCYSIENVGTNHQNMQLLPSTRFVNDILAEYPDCTQIANALTGNSTRDQLANVRAILQLFSPLDTVPSVRKIEAFRRISGGSADEADTISTGSGLIMALQRLQQPRVDAQHQRLRFDSINRFVQQVLGDPTAHLDIPHDASEILVRRGDFVLPLENLGTGTHQVVILAAAAALAEDTLLCIEEPEVHLHPLLQRKLIRYLKEETNNQYVIATHSAHLMDQGRTTVFHVQMTPSGTEILRAGTPQQLAGICADLGYRPSDLLQANAVIWVEGPSDRIYLRHWIACANPDLVEGIHFSIMFYGGRLLSHLTANDPEVDEFISLRRLNRHLAILIDSDKKTARSTINETKRRVRDEFADRASPGYAWVTDGRTIENYVPVELLREALLEVHPAATLLYDGSKWADALALSIPRRVDKVKVAQAVCRRWTTTPESRDLRLRIRQTTDFIAHANGTAPPGA